jgi:hypothetical protein
MSYATEFPAEATPPAEILALVAAGIIIDQSWGNDVCPHFEAELRLEVTPGEADKPTTLQLWSDYPENERREYPDIGRFRLLIHTDDNNPEGDVEILFTDDVNKAVSAAKFILDYYKTFNSQIAAEFTEDHFQLEIGVLGGRETNRLI